MRYLLDTDHLSVLQRQQGPAFVAVSARIAEHPVEDIVLSIVSFHEQVLGCHAYINRARDSASTVRGYAMLGQVIRDFSVAPVLPFDTSAAEVFAALIAQPRRVASMDLRIAAISLAHDCVLVTRNRRDFALFPGLRVEDWTM